MMFKSLGKHFKNVAIMALAVLVYSVITTLMIYYNQDKLEEIEAGQKSMTADPDSKQNNQPPGPVVVKQLTEPSEVVTELRQENKQLMEDVQELKQNLSQVQDELDTILKPLKEDVLSSTLKATVAYNEVLVTGGSMTPDGQYQYAFVEPVSEVLSDGTTAIHLKTKQLLIAPDVISKLGLDGLMTNAGNTLQHGEIWSSGELDDVNDMLGRGEGVSLVTAPQITVVPGKKTEMEIGDYQISTKAELVADGSGFDIELRMEQPRFSETFLNALE